MKTPIKLVTKNSIVLRNAFLKLMQMNGSSSRTVKGLIVTTCIIANELGYSVITRTINPTTLEVNYTTSTTV